MFPNKDIKLLDRKAEDLHPVVKVVTADYTAKHTMETMKQQE